MAWPFSFMAYTLLPPEMVEKSHCPHCYELVGLLMDEDRPKKPAFYICFKCEQVFQVGVGSVRKYQKIQALTGKELLEKFK